MDKTKIKKLIESANFLDEPSKEEWLLLIASANEKELTEIEAFYNKAKKAQDLYKYKIIHEANLGKEYAKKLKEISNKYTKKAIKSQEKNKQNSDENPDDILKKLYQK